MLILDKSDIVRTKPTKLYNVVGGVKPIKGTIPPNGGVDWSSVLNNKTELPNKKITVKTPTFLPTKVKTVKPPIDATIDKPLESVKEQQKTAKKIAETIAKNTGVKSIKSKVLKWGVPVLLIGAVLYVVFKGSKTSKKKLK